MSTASVGIRASKPFTPGPPPPGVPPGSVSLTTPDYGWYVSQQGVSVIGSVSYGSYVSNKGITSERVIPSGTGSTNRFRSNNQLLLQQTLQIGGTMYFYVFDVNFVGVGGTPVISSRELSLVNNTGGVLNSTPTLSPYINPPELTSFTLTNLTNANYLQVTGSLNFANSDRVDGARYQVWYKGP